MENDPFIDLEHMLGDRPLKKGYPLRNTNLQIERTSIEVLNAGAILENYFASGEAKIDPMPIEIMYQVNILLNSLFSGNLMDPYAHMGLGLFHSRKLEYFPAIGYYLFAHNITSEDWALKEGLYVKLGNVFFGLNDYESGKKFHLMAIKLNPNYVSPHLCLATHFKIMKEFNEALKYIQNAEKILPGYEVTKTIRNQILLKKFQLLKNESF